MNITLDVRHLAACVVSLVAGVALHAYAAPPYITPAPPPPADPGYPVSNPVPGVRWEFKCVDHESAAVPQNWANHDLDKPDGWNPYLAKMSAQGWEPTTFIAPNGIIMTVCFRRPAGVPAAAWKPAPPPAYPAVPPPGPSGRCTGQQIQEMRASGMSDSAVNAACKQP